MLHVCTHTHTQAVLLLLNAGQGHHLRRSVLARVRACVCAKIFSNVFGGKGETKLLQYVITCAQTYCTSTNGFNKTSSLLDPSNGMQDERSWITACMQDFSGVVSSFTDLLLHSSFFMNYIQVASSVVKSREHYE